SLLHYLAEHPRVRTPLILEFSWFTDPKARNESLQRFMERVFPIVGGEPDVRLVAKMANIYLDPKALESLRTEFPDCHLALVVRDPVLRGYSAYCMACSDGWMDFDPGFMEQLITESDMDTTAYRFFVQYGHYAEALERIYAIFPQEQVHVFRFEDLKDGAQGISDALFAAMDLRPHALAGATTAHNRTTLARSSRMKAAIRWMRQEQNPLKRSLRRMMPYQLYLQLADGLIRMNRSQQPYPTMTPTALAKWGQHFREHDARLAEMTGLDLADWTSQRTAAPGMS